MKSSMATTLLALLLVAAALSSQGQAHLGDPSLCCFEYIKKPVPLKKLVSFEYTNHRCSKPAVIFITEANKRICADPQAKWTQERIAKLSGN